MSAPMHLSSRKYKHYVCNCDHITKTIMLWYTVTIQYTLINRSISLVVLACAIYSIGIVVVVVVVVVSGVFCVCFLCGGWFRSLVIIHEFPTCFGENT